MSDELKRITCPKCGSKDQIYVYENVWNCREVAGYSAKYGHLDSEICDEMSLDFMEKIARARSEAFDRSAYEKVFLSHEPDEGVCCVWSKPKKEDLQDPHWAMAFKIMDGINMSDKQAYEIVRKFCEDPRADSPRDVMARYIEDASVRPKKQQAADLIVEMLKINATEAMNIVEKYYERGDHLKWGEDPKVIVLRRFEKE